MTARRMQSIGIFFSICCFPLSSIAISPGLAGSGMLKDYSKYGGDVTKWPEKESSTAKLFEAIVEKVIAETVYPWTNDTHMAAVYHKRMFEHGGLTRDKELLPMLADLMTNISMEASFGDFIIADILTEQIVKELMIMNESGVAMAFFHNVTGFDETWLNSLTKTKAYPYIVKGMADEIGGSYDVKVAQVFDYILMGELAMANLTRTCYEYRLSAGHDPTVARNPRLLWEQKSAPNGLLVDYSKFGANFAKWPEKDSAKAKLFKAALEKVKAELSTSKAQTGHEKKRDLKLYSQHGGLARDKAIAQMLLPEMFDSVCNRRFGDLLVTDTLGEQLLTELVALNETETLFAAIADFTGWDKAWLSSITKAPLWDRAFEVLKSEDYPWMSDYALMTEVALANLTRARKVNLLKTRHPKRRLIPLL